MKVWVLTESYDTQGEGMSDPSSLGVFATWEAAERYLPHIHFEIIHFDDVVTCLEGKSETVNGQKTEYFIDPWEVVE